MMYIKIGLVLLQTLNIGCTVFGVRTVEEPEYRVILKDENREIRKYSPSIIAKTNVKGNYKEAQNRGFQILASYIFGNNQKSVDIAMTAPVTQEPLNQSIAMTAPVTQAKQNGNWVMSFTMPSKFNSIKNLPTPLDERVILSQLPGATYATVSYSWYSSMEKNSEMGKILMKWLNKYPEYEAVSEPFYAGYNPRVDSSKLLTKF
ncbi:MAG: heme-binding protein [Oligoflexales bacterium]